MKRLVFCCLGLLALAITNPVSADTCTLVDGREINGRLVRESKTYIYFEVAGLGEIRLNKDRIVALIEDDNFGKSFQPPAPKTPKASSESEANKAEAQDREKAEPTAEDGNGQNQLSVEESEFQKTLGVASKKLSAQAKVELAQALFMTADPKTRLLRAATPSVEDAATIKALFEQSGYARKVGNRNRREVAVEKLIEYKLKALTAAAFSLKAESPYQRRSAARVIAASAMANDDWTWYCDHFKLADSLINLCGEQSNIYSFAVRGAANSALKALLGKDFGFVDNTDQLRTSSQAKAQQSWKMHWNELLKAWQEKDRMRAEKHAKLLAAWKSGFAKGDSLKKILSEDK